jgi:hypothetical protein
VPGGRSFLSELKRRNMLRAAVLYAKLGGHDQEQEAAARRALTLDPNNTHARTEYALAQALAGLGEADTAI